MADEKKEVGESREGKEPSAGTRSGMKSVVFLCLGVFVAALAGFTWMEGLFGPAPAAPVATQADSTLDSTVVLHADQPAPSHEAETLAESATRPNPNTLAEAPHQPDVTSADATPQASDEEWLRQEKLTLSRKQAELDQKSRELEKLKTEIEQLLTRVQETKSERIVMMAKLYDSMDPEAVARQISSMDDRTVVLLLPQMNTRTAAKVMAAIDPKRAAQITTKMLALEP